MTSTLMANNGCLPSQKQCNDIHHHIHIGSRLPLCLRKNKKNQKTGQKVVDKVDQKNLMHWELGLSESWKSNRGHVKPMIRSRTTFKDLTSNPLRRTIGPVRHLRDLPVTSHAITFVPYTIWGTYRWPPTLSLYFCTPLVCPISYLSRHHHTCKHHYRRLHFNTHTWYLNCSFINVY